jgi:non-ribosomal peptide synthetase component E (peptide arylation enzyme)
VIDGVVGLFDELPLSPIGKVSKKDLVARMSGE